MEYFNTDWPSGHGYNQPRGIKKCMAFFAKIDSSLTTVTSSGESVCCKSGGADSNSTKKNTEQQVSLIVYICMMSRSEKNYNDDTVKSR